MSFRTYVLTIAREGDTPAGDFIRDARDDRSFPEVDSLPALRTYLRTQGACREAVATAAVVWRNWQNWVRTNQEATSGNRKSAK